MVVKQQNWERGKETHFSLLRLAGEGCLNADNSQALCAVFFMQMDCPVIMITK